MRRIAILETGKPPAALTPVFGDYAAMFADLLGEGFQTQAYNVQAGAWPQADAFDGVIITGSASGVYEADPWIAELLDWIRQARGRTRMVGVCFGHQAMAQALGGRVEKSDKGWGVGLHAYRVVSDEAWMDPPAASVAIPVSHQDQVVERPPEARVILDSDFTPLAGLAWGDNAISMQGHPEFSPAFAAALMRLREDRIPADRVEAGLASLERPNDRALVGEWIRRFLLA